MYTSRYNQVLLLKKKPMVSHRYLIKIATQKTQKKAKKPPKKTLDASHICCSPMARVSTNPKVLLMCVRPL